MKRAFGMAAAILLAGALVTPSVQATAIPVVNSASGTHLLDLNVAPGGGDADHDGINDNLEQALAEEYAPVIGMTPDEPNYPVNVDWFLNPTPIYPVTGKARPTLEYHEVAVFQFLPDGVTEDVPLNGPVTYADLVSTVHPNSWGPGHLADSYVLHLGAAIDSTGGPRLPSAEPNPEPVETDWGARYQLSTVSSDLQKGSLNPADWTTYVHVYPNDQGGITIQYWHVFMYNYWDGLGEGYDNHDADWDASMQIVLNAALQPTGAYYSRHSEDHPGQWQEWGTLHLYQDTHPLMIIDTGGHGAYADHQDCEDYWSLSDHGWYGSCHAVSWTNPDAADVVGTVWETWSEGVVRQVPAPEIPGLTQHKILGTVQSDGSIVATPGPMVNVGEYNPDIHQSTQETYPDIQGPGYSPLGLTAPDNFYPLNGQVWIKYSGEWGGAWNWPAEGAPRGPVFQGWANRGVKVNGVPTGLSDWRYWSWYWGAAPTPAMFPLSPWRMAPITSLATGSPTLGLDGRGFVSSNTLCATRCALGQTFKLTPVQSPLAAGFGASHTYFRIYRTGGPAPEFSSYYDPFTLPGATGQYTLDYYTEDALGNVELSKTQDFTVSTLASLAVAPANQTVAAGLTQQFTATGTYTDASTADLTGLVKWTAGNLGVATIRATGLARGVSPGASTIEATLGSVSGSTVLTVGPAEPLSISVAYTIAAGTTTPVIFTFANVPETELRHLRAWITCGAPSPEPVPLCPTPVGFIGVPGSTIVDGGAITFANQTQNPDGSYSGSGTAMLIVGATYFGPAYLTFTDEVNGAFVGTNIAELTIADVSETLSVSTNGVLDIQALAAGTTNPLNLTFANVPAAGLLHLDLTLACGTPTGESCGSFRGVPGSTTVDGTHVTFLHPTQNPDGTYSGSGTVMHTAASSPNGAAFARFIDTTTGAEAWDAFSTYTTSETLSVSLAPTVTVVGEYPVTLTFDNVPAANVGHLQAWLICGIPTEPTPCGGYGPVPGDTTVTGDTITFANQTQNPDGTYSGSGTVMYHAPTTYLGPSYMTFFDRTTGDLAAANSTDFTIVPVKSQTITFANPGNQLMPASPLTVAASASSGLPVTLTSSSLPVCTVAGMAVTFVAPGTCSITASQDGDQYYSAASPVEVRFKINKANQAITFPNPGNQRMAASPLTVSATASSGLPVTLTSTTTAVCSVGELTVTFLTTGTCTITASQDGNANYNAAKPVTRSFTITAMKANQAITFPTPGNQLMTASPLTVTATASSGLPVTLTSTTLPVCTVAGMTVTFVKPGTCSITASQDGDAEYNAATPVTRSFTIAKANQTITFLNPGTQKLAASPLTVSATASSGLPVTLTSTTLPVCTVAGMTVTFVKPGTCSITASQDGNPNYNPAPPVTVRFSIR